MQKSLTQIFIFLFTTFCVAQNPITYTTKHGLPSNTVYDIVQDKEGFMWFATNRGVAKFDGETFKTFTMKDGLPNNDTWKLEADLQGRVWYISKSKYQGYIKNDSVYKFKTEDDEVLSPSIIKTKTEVSIIGGKLYKVEEQQLKIIYDAINLDSLYTNAEIKKSNQNLTFILNDTIVAHIEPNRIRIFNDNFFQLYEKPISLNKVPKAIFLRNAGSFGYNNTLVWLSEASIIFFNTKSKKHKIINLVTEEANSLENNGHCRIMFLPNEIQIKAGANLFRYDYNFDKIEHITILDNEINAAYLDNYNNLWMASSAGVQLITATQRNVTTHLPSKNIQRLGSINNTLYAGERNAGFYALNGDKFPSTPNFIGGGEVYDIKEMSNSESSFLLSGKTSFKNNKNSFKKINLNELTNYNAHLSELSFKNITFFNNEYYTVISIGMMQIDKEFKSYKLGVYRSGLFDVEIFNNKLYVGGSDGLHEHLENSLLKILPNNELSNISILTMYADQKSLFVGTDGRGVYTYNGTKIAHLKATDELSIQEILKERDTLWLATQEGVKKVLLKNGNIEESTIIDQFVDADGIFDNNINDIYKSNNTLFVATDRGISELDLTSPEYKIAPSVYFKTKNDTLNYTYSKEKDITIAFGAIVYGNEENITFEYRLKPNQEQWTKSPSKSVTFSNLSPGNHTLEIKGTNQHFKTGTALLSLKIKPLWWQTTIAAGGFSLLGLLGLLGFGYVIKKTIQKTEYAKNKREKQIAGLELQALRSQMNPHFVHNSLNAIQYFIQRNEVEQSENYLAQFSLLIRLFFEYSRRQTITIKEELELLTNYLEIEKLRFEEELQYTISVCDGVDIEDQHIPSMLLQPIVENAVNHGLFHKRGKGFVELHFKQIDEKSFSVTIKDDGIGIKKSKQISKSSSKNYQSNSSKVLYERLDLLNKSREWDIKYEIQDESDLDVNKTGTKVTLIFNQNNGQ